jgi:hypothetical protein
VLYVLTDGFDQINDFETIPREFARLNKDKKVKVNCILLSSDATRDPIFVKILDRVAPENGGVMKVVDKGDLK